MKVKSKKGSTMVEAAMIFPIVISAVMAVLYIVISLYSSLSLQTSLHLALRKECGDISETIYRSDEMKEFDYEKKPSGLRSVVTMEESQEFRIKGMFAHKLTRKEAGRSYVIDEAEIVRLRIELKEAFE